MRERYSGVSLIVFTSVALTLLAWALVKLDVEWIKHFALHPEATLSGSYLWALFFHMFVHASLLHLMLNMYVMASLGPLCERILGRRTFLRFYILSGIFAGLLSAVLSGFFGEGSGARVFGGSNVFLMGGSGAIFALAGFFMIVLPKARFSIVFLPFFSLRGYIMIPLILFATWGFSIWGDLPIGNVAHFGGCLAGVLFGAYARVAYRGRVIWVNYLMRYR